MGSYLSKLQGPPRDPDDISTLEIILVLIRSVSLGFASFYSVRWVCRLFDTSYWEEQRRVDKALEIMKRLNLKRNISLNCYELCMVSNLVAPDELNVSWEDVAGLETIEQLKKTVIYPILLKQKGGCSDLLQPPKGVLLYGPPGCGKTLLAKAMTSQVRCAFINLNISDLSDMLLGESQKRVHGLFTLAHKIQPCIIFIDEIDALLRVRDETDHEASAQLKAQFMSLWDGFITDTKKTIIVMGATNRPKDLDSAILRRMTCKFLIPPPDVTQRMDILGLVLRHADIAPDVDVARLAGITDGFSGSDLQEVGRAAAVECLADMSDRVRQDEELRQSHPTSVPTRSWFQRLNPFSRGSRSSSESDSNEDEESASIRQITMKDFELAITKLKVTKVHCATPDWSGI